jgi:hypothetical protein
MASLCRHCRVRRRDSTLPAALAIVITEHTAALVLSASMPLTAGASRGEGIAPDAVADDPCIVDVNDAQAFEHIIACMRAGVVMIQMAGSYTLLAQPTLAGVEQLDRVKSRLPNKYYTSCLGDVPAFLRSLPEGAAPPELLAEDGRLFEQALAGKLVRVQFAAAGLHTPVLVDGTHQAYVSTGRYRELFQACERAFEQDDNAALYAGVRYHGCIASSANMSGAPTITERDAALSFARDRGVRMLITDRSIAPLPPEKRGSLAIYGLSARRITELRKGPMMDETAAWLPAHLQPTPTLSNH